ncbi:MAG: non-canonical purine NTP diphosphatase [Prevotella sp.]|jgi:XTP/dITP diphosphohydrolase|nr:non-canonical purine NTP diphosphatase [Prevotella sp.]MCH4182251.1 non-canonical purine NTP diphosphatase [Prevotella sp.]MCH4211216.1 non-canonical purine NTP diphosphatase [Prevotella sp.]MCH4241216.1 non-canonical purine NTP diphosphatase [Prevotella sp.]
MNIVFATNNKDKLREIREILEPEFNIISLSDIGCHEDIPETGKTLEENSLLKAQYVYDHYHQNCFADDTGLEVDALNGEPGVHSARYAEDTDHDNEANIKKLLSKLENKNNRKAKFRTVITLIQRSPDPTHRQVINCFEGEISGTIAKNKLGIAGFGYDPLFIPEGYKESFAQMGDIEKNKISHRARAVSKLVEFLKKQVTCINME